MAISADRAEKIIEGMRQRTGAVSPRPSEKIRIFAYPVGRKKRERQERAIGLLFRRLVFR